MSAICGEGEGSVRGTWRSRLETSEVIVGRTKGKWDLEWWAEEGEKKERDGRWAVKSMLWVLQDDEKRATTSMRLEIVVAAAAVCIRSFVCAQWIQFVSWTVSLLFLLLSKRRRRRRLGCHIYNMVPFPSSLSVFLSYWWGEEEEKHFVESNC